MYSVRTRVGIFIAATSLLVYVLTLSPAVGFDDSGELAAAQYTLGIAHPTGYPLFTLLGRAFVLLPGGASVIWKLNFLGALLCALAAALYYRLFLRLISGPLIGVRGDARGNALDPLAAAVAALSLAFSGVYWSQAVSLEVYAVHLVFIALACLLFLSALPARETRHWAAFAFILGLGFTNHMMMVLLAPAFLYLLVATHGWRFFIRRVMLAIPPFAAGLLLYLYFPLRAAAKPAMNWGDPRAPEAFWRHVSGAQFRYKMFSSGPEVALHRVKDFFAELLPAFGYVPLLFVPVGLWALRKQNGRRPRLLVFSLLLFFGCVLYAANYDIPDLRAYYLQAHVAAAAWIAFGVQAVLARTSGKTRVAAASLCLAVFLFPLLLNYRTQDRSRDHAVEEYARNVLESVDAGGVLFTNEYWIVKSPADYLQLVEKFRPDVVVLDVGLFAHDWFYDQLETRHPGLADSSRHEIEAYRIEIRKQLRGDMDTAAYQARLADMFGSLMRTLRKKHPVYVTSGINIRVLEGDYYHVPSGLVFRLMHGEDPAFVPAVRIFEFHPLPAPEGNPMSDLIRGEYANGYANQGNYRLALGDTATGISLLRKALAINPGFVEVARLIEKTEAR